VWWVALIAYQVVVNPENVARVLRDFKAEMEQIITAAKTKVLTEASQEHTTNQLPLKIDF
jgi:ribosomal protein L25 (general stress protein Ctc)